MTSMIIRTLEKVGLYLNSAGGNPNANSKKFQDPILFPETLPKFIKRWLTLSLCSTQIFFLGKFIKILEVNFTL